MESPEGNGIYGSGTQEGALGWRYRFCSNLQTMVVKIRQADELTKGSCEKLLREKTIKGIFALKNK